MAVVWLVVLLAIMAACRPGELQCMLLYLEALVYRSNTSLSRAHRVFLLRMEIQLSQAKSRLSASGAFSVQLHWHRLKVPLTVLRKRLLQLLGRPRVRSPFMAAVCSQPLRLVRLVSRQPARLLRWLTRTR